MRRVPRVTLICGWCGDEFLREPRRANIVESPCCSRSCSSRMTQDKRYVDKTGQKYGKLLVLKRLGVEDKIAIWLCLCDCGNETVVRGYRLAKKGNPSCGCHLKDSRRPYANAVPGRLARNVVLKNYRAGAKQRGLAWGLDDAIFDRLTASHCTYCGAPPSRVSKPSRNGSFTYNGIDRIDNNVGYIDSNVVPCCWVCNHAKSNMTQRTFLEWIDRLVTHARHRQKITIISTTGYEEPSLHQVMRPLESIEMAS